MTGRHFLAILALVAVGCLEAPETGAPDGAYRLVAVASRPLASYNAPNECFQVPARSEYRFSGTNWRARDSARLSEACPLDSANVVQVDSGYFRMAGDTVHFWVRDTTIGLRGWVNAGILRGDILILPGGEFDPGDFVYARVP